jgi:hypothetical protein
MQQQPSHLTQLAVSAALFSWTAPAPADGDAAAACTGRWICWGWLIIARNSDRYSLLSPSAVPLFHSHAHAHAHAHCPCPCPCPGHSANATMPPPAMSPGGAGHFREPPAVYEYDYAPRMDSLSNVLAGTSTPHHHHNSHGARLPTIQPAPPNKGAPHASPPPPLPSRPPFFPAARGHAHAAAIASAGSSTTESQSDLTSSSSRDSLPNPHGRPGPPTTPQKPARNNRRKQSNKANPRWSRGRASSDDTGSDRKPPTSQPSEPTVTSSPHAQPSIATNPAPTSQPRSMATAFGGPSGDSRRGVVSPRPKGRGMMHHTHVVIPSCRV